MTTEPNPKRPPYMAAADPVDTVRTPRFFATNADGLVYEHTATLNGIMPESGTPAAGVPIQ